MAVRLYCACHSSDRFLWLPEYVFRISFLMQKGDSHCGSRLFDGVIILSVGGKTLVVVQGNFAQIRSAMRFIPASFG